MIANSFCLLEFINFFRDRRSKGAGRDILPDGFDRWWTAYLAKFITGKKSWATPSQLSRAVTSFFVNWHDIKRKEVVDAMAEPRVPPGTSFTQIGEATAEALLKLDVVHEMDAAMLTQQMTPHLEKFVAEELQRHNKEKKAAAKKAAAERTERRAEKAETVARKAAEKRAETATNNSSTANNKVSGNIPLVD
jgi:hypothetical protein